MKFFIALLLLLIPLPTEALRVLDCPREVKQGEIGIVEVEAEGMPEGRFEGAELPFYRWKGGWRGLLAVDFRAKAGPRKLTLRDAREKVILSVIVKEGEFGLQRLSLPREMVELKGEVLQRVRREKALIRRALSTWTLKPAWRRPFLLPLHGRVSGPFGLVRIINGRFRGRHTGVDIAAPEGTPVAATNDGRVVLASRLFLEGNTVIIDHGLGLFSLYLHLKEIFVRKGQKIRRGQSLGLVGASGRAKGPHLHWGIVLRGKKVDPFSLLDVLGEKGWRRGLSKRP